MSNTSLIIKREYLERVNKKSFIVTTILVPILMLGMMLLPTLIMLFAEGNQKTVAVIDSSQQIYPNLVSNDQVRFIEANTDSLQSYLKSDSIFGVLLIDSNIFQNSNAVKLISSNEASASVESTISSQMQKIIETQKLKAYNIDNLDRILADVSSPVQLHSVRIDDDGSDEKSQSAELSAMLGTVLNLILYMFLLIYGQLVMSSIIEEKNNRVLEIMVSSVKPTQLMLGKIIGVGLIALTQILIWAAVIVCGAMFILPTLIPEATMQQAAEISAGGTGDMDLTLAQLINSATNVASIIQTMLLIIGFLIGGYFLFATIFAAIGAGVDNQQDASQLQIIGMLPIMVGLFASLAVVADPGSTFALVMSLIPFTSPMVMVCRIPFGIPGWQIALSFALLFLTCLFMVWFAAKVYRVGIFMYGKKPTLRDLIRWARYK
ncbi:MAG: ABC transporter permease [Bacteroidales bacterium]|nr:ABC transporter permease [Bacteroidales bacterium]